MRMKNLVLLLAICLTISFLPYENHEIDLEYSDFVNFAIPNLKTSQYVNLTGRRICINDGWDDIWPYNTYNYLETSDKKTWAELAAAEDWCNGSGTSSDPYIIENVYLDCQEMGAGISIFLSNVHFIIRNCYILNSGIGDYNTGISLIHVQNGQIKYNLFAYDFHSIWLWESSNNLISHNEMIHNTTTSGLITAGKIIKIEASNDNIVSNNKALDYYDGICIWESNYNLITENFIETNKFGHYPDTGLYLVDSNYSTITYNSFAGDYAKYPNPYGESIINEQNCVGNTIENNFNEQPIASLSMLSFFKEIRIKLSNPDSWFTLSNSNYNYIYGNRLYTGEVQIIEGYSIYFLIGVLGVILTVDLSLISLRKKAKAYNY